MSVVQSFDEIISRDILVRWAYDNPNTPRVVGIDVGQANLALWLGAPMPAHQAMSLSDVRFLYMGWVIIHCSSTSTTAHACRLVETALGYYRRRFFALATDIVIEKQHKKNPRMRAIAATIRAWIRKKVPHARQMRVVERQALNKFANIVQLPCPMPRDYQQRKAAALRVVDRQTRTWAGQRWWGFLQAHIASGDDLADAALIAQDYMIAQYLMCLVASASLAEASALLLARRNRNSWRRTTRTVTVDVAGDSDESSETMSGRVRLASTALDETEGEAEVNDADFRGAIQSSKRQRTGSATDSLAAALHQFGE